MASYLEARHPGALVWALLAKIAIVYGALAFVLWQFRPSAEEAVTVSRGAARDRGDGGAPAAPTAPAPDRLASLADIDSHDRLRTRYEGLLDRQRRGGD